MAAVVAGDKIDVSRKYDIAQRSRVMMAQVSIPEHVILKQVLQDLRMY